MVHVYQNLRTCYKLKKIFLPCLYKLKEKKLATKEPLLAHMAFCDYFMFIDVKMFQMPGDSPSPDSDSM